MKELHDIERKRAAEKKTPLPRRGDVWSHIDGGSVYVLGKYFSRIEIQRRPFGDSQAKIHQVSLTEFFRETNGKLKHVKLVR